VIKINKCFTCNVTSILCRIMRAMCVVVDVVATVTLSDTIRCIRAPGWPADDLPGQMISYPIYTDQWALCGQVWPGDRPPRAPRHTQIPDTAMKTSLSHTTHSRYMDSFITTVIKCLKSRSIMLFRLIFKLVIITLLENNYLVSLSN